MKLGTNWRMVVLILQIFFGKKYIRLAFKQLNIIFLCLRHAVHFVDGLDRQLFQWNEDIPNQEEEPILPIMPMLDPHLVDNLAPAEPLLVPLPVEERQFPPLNLPLQFQPPIPPVLNEPPPLIYFHRVPNPPSPPHLHLEPIPPPQSPDVIPNRSPSPPLDDDLVDAPLSPEHPQNPTNDPLPIYNFPPIPENVARAFARFGEEDDPVIEEGVSRKYTCFLVKMLNNVQKSSYF